MSKRRRITYREATRQEILDTARVQMEKHGTAGLSIRGIARKLEMTPPAIYHYFAGLDDMITALILEDFHAQADAMEVAVVDCESNRPVDRLMAALAAYRAWAVTHPIDYQLISGNPIPGYHAPREITVPASARRFMITIGLIMEALEQGEIIPPDVSDLPLTLRDHLLSLNEGHERPAPLAALYMTLVGMTETHGIVSLEIYNQLQPIAGDVEAYYLYRMKTLFQVVE
jgi:AcrR family transcriptional regulator